MKKRLVLAFFIVEIIYESLVTKSLIMDPVDKYQFQVNNKNTRVMSIIIVLQSLLFNWNKSLPTGGIVLEREFG